MTARAGELPNIRYRANTMGLQQSNELLDLPDRMTDRPNLDSFFRHVSDTVTWLNCRFAASATTGAFDKTDGALSRPDRSTFLKYRSPDWWIGCSSCLPQENYCTTGHNSCRSNFASRSP